jgi:hypothetical protein
MSLLVSFCFHGTPIRTATPLRKHAADALIRARKLPVGHARNDLRQLAMGLLWLDRKGLQAAVKDRVAALLELQKVR